MPGAYWLGRCPASRLAEVKCHHPTLKRARARERPLLKKDPAMNECGVVVRMNGTGERGGGRTEAASRSVAPHQELSQRTDDGTAERLEPRHEFLPRWSIEWAVSQECVNGLHGHDALLVIPTGRGLHGLMHA